MMYGIFGKDGRIQTAHNDETASKLPKKAFELNPEQWDGRFDLQIVNGELISNPLPKEDNENSGN